MTPSLGSALSNRSKQKTIPAVVIDVLGNRCSVRLSGRGTKLTGLEFVGSVPKIGDLVIVDYRNANTPIVLTSGSVVTAAPQPITAAVVPAGSANPAETINGDLVDFPDMDGLKYIVQDREWVGFNHAHNNWDGTNNISQAESHQDADTDLSTTSIHHTLGTSPNQAASGNHTHPISTMIGFIGVFEDISNQIGLNGNHFTLSAFAEILQVTVNGLEQKVTDIVLDDDCMGFTFVGAASSNDEMVVRYTTNLDNVLFDEAGHLLYDDANEILFT